MEKIELKAIEKKLNMIYEDLQKIIDITDYTTEGIALRECLEEAQESIDWPSKNGIFHYKRGV